MAGRGDHPDPRPDLRFPVQQLVRSPAELDGDRHRVVGLVRGRVFRALGKDRPPREPAVSTGVVEVEVAVRDGCDVIGPDIRTLQRSVKRPGHRAVMRLGLGVRLGEPGVEQEEAARVADQVGADDDRLAGERIARTIGHGEVAEIQTRDVTNGNHPAMVRVSSVGGRRE